MEKKSRREDVNTRHSKHPGLLGLIETLMRRLNLFFQCLILIPVAVIYLTCLGLALVPGISLFQWVLRVSESLPLFFKYFSWGAAIAAGYFSYGLSMIFIIPAACFVLRAYPKPFRGPYFSAETLPWYLSNGLLYLVRYSFLEFVTPTPFNHLFYRMMGMKMGRGAQINSTHISDPAMIILGKKVTIGGSAVIIGHYGQSGYLVIAPVIIEDGATVGLRATIMGDVIIGANAKILPNSVVLPKTRVPAGETWGGVPARRIDPVTLRNDVA